MHEYPTRSECTGTATSTYVNDGRFAKIYQERTGKTLARRSKPPPPAKHCCDLAHYRMEEIA